VYLFDLQSQAKPAAWEDSEGVLSHVARGNVRPATLRYRPGWTIHSNVNDILFAQVCMYVVTITCQWEIIYNINVSDGTADVVDVVYVNM
jgi:hypothetical protein